MAALNENSIALLSTTAIADLSSVADTTIYTVPTGKTCILSEAWLRVAGDVGANLVCRIGQNGAETDFVGNTNGDNLDASGDCIILKPIPQATPTTNKVYAAATVIEFSVSVGGNAVAGTVYLFGFLY
jgi:hypothetical protein